VSLFYSRNEIRANNLFNVADCKIHWQKSGDHLCVKVDRYSKVKKEKNEVKYSVRTKIIFIDELNFVCININLLLLLFFRECITTLKYSI
jgi:hypothetical protein